MINQSRFDSTMRYRCYLADVEVWGEEKADELWEDEFKQEANLSIEEKIRKDNATRFKQGGRVRRFENLTKGERDNLVVQEARLIINLIVLGDKDDRESFQDYLVKAVDNFRTCENDRLRDALKKCIIGSVKEEALFRLRNRSYPESGLHYLTETTVVAANSRPNCKYPNCTIEIKNCETCHDNPKNMKQEDKISNYNKDNVIKVEDYRHHCIRCGSDVVGSLDTLRYHTDVTCPQLPSNRIKSSRILNSANLATVGD